jgi:hypothetical protein
MFSSVAVGLIMFEALTLVFAYDLLHMSFWDSFDKLIHEHSLALGLTLFMNVFSLSKIRYLRPEQLMVVVRLAYFISATLFTIMTVFPLTDV